MACSRCQELERKVADLEEETAYLRRELGLQIEETRVAQLHDAFGLSRQQALFVLTLYAAKGRTVTYAQIDEVLPKLRTDERCEKYQRQLTAEIRKRMGRGYFVASYGIGFRMTPLGLKLVREVVEDERFAPGGAR